MIWVTGSGRCGTKSFSEISGFPHEPGKWFLGEFSRYAESGENEDKLRHFVAMCRNQDAEGIVDARFSLILPLILEADPEARFIVLFRDPVLTVRSWLSRGAWSEKDQNGAGKVVPPEDLALRSEKAAWYWHFLYSRILEHLDGTWPEFVETEELPVVSNRCRRLMRPTSKDFRVIIDRCQTLYERLQERIADRRPIFDTLLAAWKTWE